MKKVHSINREALRLLTTALLLFVVCVVANAYDFRVDGIYYKVLDATERTCEVTYLSTSNSNYSAYQGSVVIPNTVEYDNVTYAVRGINDSAFEGCTALTEITIPNSVTEIGNRAFWDCTGLTEITIPNSVTSIGNRAFYGCSGLTGELIIPGSVTEIGEYAFNGCTGLTGELIIPNSVTEIGECAFYKCKALTEVTIGNSVTEIGSCTFLDCTGLTEVTIGESVTSIGSDAFYGCTGLTQVNFNAIACTSAGSSPHNAFAYCTHISTMNFGDNVTIIPQYLCLNLSGLTGVTIPNSVKTIGSYAFDGCSRLTEITFPNSVTSIDSYAFCGCTGLTSVNIGNGVTEIGKYTFYGCNGLTSIYSLNPEPPKCGSSAFANVPTGTCVLYVPYGSIGAYATTSPWSSFYNIIEIEVDAIADITTNGNAEATEYYTLDGKQVPTLQRGINIIRYSDGIARKVLVK